MRAINWEGEQSTFCCGLIEIGNMERGFVDDWWGSRQSKTPTEALTAMRALFPGFPLMFNFTSRVPKDLRDLVQAQKDWILVHKWRNPNSGNIITCGFLTNGSNQAKCKEV